MEIVAENIPEIITHTLQSFKSQVRKPQAIIDKKNPHISHQSL